MIFLTFLLMNKLSYVCAYLVSPLSLWNIDAAERLCTENMFKCRKFGYWYRCETDKYIFNLSFCNSSWTTLFFFYFMSRNAWNMVRDFSFIKFSPSTSSLVNERNSNVYYPPLYVQVQCFWLFDLFMIYLVLGLIVTNIGSENRCMNLKW